MPWRILPGYQHPEIVLSTHDEEGVAHYWVRARHLDGTSCRLHRPNDPVIEGTRLSSDARVAGTHQGTCQDCAKEFWSRDATALFCVGCEVAAGPMRAPVPEIRRTPPPPPAIGIHEAGEPVVTLPLWRQARVQYCLHCDAVLGDEHRYDDGPAGTHQSTVPQTIYPVGALIERGRGWQAARFGSPAVTCVPREADLPVAVAVRRR